MSNGHLNRHDVVGGSPGRLTHVLFGLGIRLYAVALIGVIAFLSYSALRYLVSSIANPTAAPAQISRVIKRMDEATLAVERPDWLGLSVTNNPRTPLEHYHHIGAWARPDRFNDCTRSGCHAAMPHSRDKGVRAFLNLHAGTVQCGVCHIPQEQTPLPVAWYSLDNGQLRSPPDLLRAYDWLERPEHKDSTHHFTPAEQEEIAGLLAAAAREAQDVNGLKYLAEEVRVTRTINPEFRRLLEDARETLPTYFRGEYGTKLALVDASKSHPILEFPGVEGAINEYLKSEQNVAPERRTSLIQTIHVGLRKPTLHCKQCHSATESLVAFAKVGYPEARLKSLQHAMIFDMIEHISRGEPFYLPNFTQPLP